MITRTQSSQLFISIFILSLIWSIGKRGSQTLGSLEKGTQVTFSFSLPSMREYLGPTGETDLFTPQEIQWVSLSESNLFFSSKGIPVKKVTPLENDSNDTPTKALAFLPRKLRVKPVSNYRRLPLTRKWERTPHPVPTKGEGRVYRKKATSRVGWRYKNLPSNTHWEEV